MKILIVLICILCTAFTAYIPGMFSISSDAQIVIDNNSATVFITEYTNSTAGYEVYVYSAHDWAIHYFTYDGVKFHNPTGKILLTDSIHRTPANGLTKEFTLYIEDVEEYSDQLVFTIVAK
jgi:hypothetical protein